MSKHTPGPWHVIERANGQAFSVGCQVQTKGNFLTTHYIANITDMPTPEAKAVARLIAAAPAMLEALKGVIRVADRATVEFDAARAAVESAEGLNDG